MKKVFVTGGAGYIGAHTCVELLQAGYEIVILDNLSNSKRNVMDRIERIAGRRVEFVEGDIRDRALLDQIFSMHAVAAVIHFAGSKAVGESVVQPLAYYNNNVYGSMALCEAMAAHRIKNMVFSSSATVYGDPHAVPIREDFPLQATNPYGRSKLMIEEMLRDLHVSDPQWNIALLRYFNPVGAHESGLIGEDPNCIPNNLMPYICQVAAGKLSCLSVFGNDYPTPDGTGVRDYIHVVDLAKGHLKALTKLGKPPGMVTCNLGTGRGYSVLEMVAAFERASGKKIPYQFIGRRPGDVPACYADASVAQSALGWRAVRGLEEMCADAWRWQQWLAAHRTGGTLTGLGGPKKLDPT